MESLLEPRVKILATTNVDHLETLHAVARAGFWSYPPRVQLMAAATNNSQHNTDGSVAQPMPSGCCPRCDAGPPEPA
eukprot:11205651-Lingulodinium_polyedra.AAC.1